MWSAFYVHPGTANWNSILSRHDLSELRSHTLWRARAEFRSDSKLSFFCPEMYVNGWFFDIYIQGSKKVQL
jgi:hypothetical protein